MKPALAFLLGVVCVLFLGGGTNVIQPDTERYTLSTDDYTLSTDDIVWGTTSDYVWNHKQTDWTVCTWKFNVYGQPTPIATAHEATGFEVTSRENLIDTWEWTPPVATYRVEISPIDCKETLDE